MVAIHAEGSVSESAPARRRDDVVSEQDQPSVDELPARGLTDRARAQWSSSVVGARAPRAAARPQQVRLYDEHVIGQPSVVESQPETRRSDVVREEDETEAEVVLKRGFARHIAAAWTNSRPSETTLDVAALRGGDDSGVRENQPQARLEGVIRAGDPADDDSLSAIEGSGLARSLATHWSTTSHGDVVRQPFRMELDVDPTETSVFENTPQQVRAGVVRCTDELRETMGQRGQIRHISARYAATADSASATPSTAAAPRPPGMIAIDLAEGPAVLENEPAALDPSVVRGTDSVDEIGAVVPGTTRSMLDRWTSQHDLSASAQDAARATPAWLADWETTPAGSGVFENTPAESSEDVIREQDHEPEMISVRQTRRARALWTRLETEDSMEQLQQLQQDATPPEVRACVITHSLSCS